MSRKHRTQGFFCCHEVNEKPKCRGAAVPRLVSSRPVFGVARPGRALVEPCLPSFPTPVELHTCSRVSSCLGVVLSVACRFVAWRVVAYRILLGLFQIDSSGRWQPGGIATNPCA